VLRWPEHIRIGLCANRVLWTRATVFPQRIIEKRAIVLGAESNILPWKDALEAVAAELEKEPLRARRATVVLSNRFVRFAVMPWHDALMRRQERIAQAQRTFKEIYGPMAANWAIDVCGSDYRGTVLAAAIDDELLQGLRTAFAKQRIALASIQPYMTACLGQFRRQLPRTGSESQFICVVEPNDLCVLQFHKDTLVSSDHRRIQSDWMSELKNVLLHRANQATPTIAIFAPEQPEVSPSAVSLKVTKLHLPALPGFKPLLEGAFSIPLSAQSHA
jgi:hypothetical protein